MSVSAVCRVGRNALPAWRTVVSSLPISCAGSALASKTPKDRKMPATLGSFAALLSVTMRFDSATALSLPLRVASESSNDFGRSRSVVGEFDHRDFLPSCQLAGCPHRWRSREQTSQPPIAGTRTGKNRQTHYRSSDRRRVIVGPQVEKWESQSVHQGRE